VLQFLVLLLYTARTAGNMVRLGLKFPYSVTLQCRMKILDDLSSW